MNKFISRPIYLFMLSKSKLYLVLITVMMILIVMLNHWVDTKWDNVYVKFIDPFLGLTTVIIALLIWYSQMKINWRSSLPKRLTVHFKYKEEVIMSCYEAYLSGESDIRAWSQQIGRQMNDNVNLDFYPYIDSPQPEIVSSFTEKNEDGSYISVQLYTVYFYLRNVDLLKDALQDQYLVWLDNNTNNSGKNGKFYVSRKKEPFTHEEAITEFQKSRIKN